MVATSVNSNSLLRLVCCSIGSETYCLDMTAVLSVQSADLLKYSDTVGQVVGWLTVDNQELPVFSLANLLKRPFRQNIAAGKVVILNTGEEMLVLMVDRVSQVVEVAAEAQHPLPTLAEDLSLDLFKGLVQIQENLVLYLALDKLNPNSSRVVKSKSRSLVKDKELPTQTNSVKAGPGRILLFATLETEVDELPLLFGLSISQVLEIQELVPIIPMPTAPNYLLGLVYWRNMPVPVLDLNLLLGLDAQAVGHNQRLLIVHGVSRPEPLGFIVHSEVRIENLPLVNRPLDLELAINKDLSKGIFELEKAILIVPDIDKILLVTGAES